MRGWHATHMGLVFKMRDWCSRWGNGFQHQGPVFSIWTGVQHEGLVFNIRDLHSIQRTGVQHEGLVFNTQGIGIQDEELVFKMRDWFSTSGTSVQHMDWCSTWGTGVQHEGLVFNMRDWCSAWGTGVQHTRDWCLAQGTTQYLYMNSMTGHWLWKPTTFTTSPNRYRYKQDGLVITTSYSSPSSACNKKNGAKLQKQQQELIW